MAKYTVTVNLETRGVSGPEHMRDNRDRWFRQCLRNFLAGHSDTPYFAADISLSDGRMTPGAVIDEIRQLGPSDQQLVYVAVDALRTTTQRVVGGRSDGNRRAGGNRGRPQQGRGGPSGLPLGPNRERVRTAPVLSSADSSAGRGAVADRQGSPTQVQNEGSGDNVTAPIVEGARLNVSYADALANTSQASASATQNIATTSQAGALATGKKGARAGKATRPKRQVTFPPEVRALRDAHKSDFMALVAVGKEARAVQPGLRIPLVDPMDVQDPTMRARLVAAQEKSDASRQAFSTARIPYMPLKEGESWSDSVEQEEAARAAMLPSAPREAVGTIALPPAPQEEAVETTTSPSNPETVPAAPQQGGTGMGHPNEID